MVHDTKTGKIDTPLEVVLIVRARGYATLLASCLTSASGFLCRPRHASTIEDGLTMLRESSPDLVLLDLSLPGTDGLSHFRTLRLAAPNTPVVLLASQYDERLALEAMKDGAQDFLVKWKEAGNPQQPAAFRQACRYAIERHRITASLAESLLKQRAGEERFQHLIEQNADAMLIIGENGHVLFANPAAGTLFGSSVEELTGRDMGFPLAGEDTTEIELLLANGSVYTAEMRTVSIEWENQPAFLASLRDVSERKDTEMRLRELLALHEKTLATIPACVLVLDTDMTVLTANPYCLKAIDRQAEAIVGQNYEELVEASCLGHATILPAIREALDSDRDCTIAVPCSRNSGPECRLHVCLVNTENTPPPPGHPRVVLVGGH